MSSVMTAAQGSVEVGIPPDKAKEKWTEWTKQGGPGMSQGGDKSGNIPAELAKVEQGMAYFEPGTNGNSRVRMELKVNPDALKKEGLDQDWVEKRINLYLTRFKNFAEGRPA
jgi:hypothetical protein